MQPTLLLVDDEINILRALERVFEDEGYRILTATSGAEALSILAESPAQVIISDQRMPKMTGSEFFIEVKKKYPDSIRIILSAYADFDAVREAINEGSIYKFFNKPWDDSVLKQVVKEGFLQHAQHQDKELHYAELLKRFRLSSKANAVEVLDFTAEELREGLAKNQFIVYYQPIMDTKTLKIVGAEALLRWQHPTKGLLEPLTFIPSCEATGLIVPIGGWVLKEACHQLKRWSDLKHMNLTISVNISAVQFNDPGLFQLVKGILEETKMPATCLQLEITESVAIQNVETSTLLLSMLKDLGVAVVLDDFGTGYSSLQYLKDLPVSILKIDKSFIQDMAIDPVCNDIVDAIVLLAKNLHLGITAEGVETPEQLKALQIKNCCDYLQGFLFSKPLPSDDFVGLLGV